MVAAENVPSERRRLRSLFVTAWYPSKQIPVEGIFVREHAKAVSGYDDVVVLHLAGDDPAMKRIWRLEEETDPALTEGIPTYRVWWRRSPIPYTTYPLSLWGAVQAWRRLVAKGFTADVIHAHIHTAGPSAVFMAKLGKLPLVISEHSSAFPRRLLSPFAVRAARWSFRSARVVLPVSHALQNAIEQLGVPARFQVVPNVVDLSLFHPPKKKASPAIKTVLFVGLLSSPIKGLPHLLDAAVRLRARRRDWRLRIVGDGPLRDEYEAMAARLALNDHVVFAGRKTKAEVAEEMRDADVLVLPSLWENLPCVLIEAQASGLPVVASQVGGIPEIVTAGTGHLVPPGDVEALAAALDKVLKNSAEFDGAAIRVGAERYSHSAVGRQLHEIYEGVRGGRVRVQPLQMVPHRKAS